MDRPRAVTGGPDPAAAQQALIGAVRRFLRHTLPDDDGELCVGLSGGADSLALTAAAVRSGRPVRALIVDHGLQEGSAVVAARAAEQARALEVWPQVLTVHVPARGGGPEAAARTARYTALDEARDGRPVLLGHTLDDQAETVLLGLGRGAGARSLSGMAAWREPWGRPLLGVRRAQTRAACAGWGLTPWDDPHNDDPRFTRVRLRREVLPLLDDVLGGGVASALARTAGRLHDDDAALEEWAQREYPAVVSSGVTGEQLDTAAALDLPAAVRSRLVRRWLLTVGATEPTARVTAQVLALITDWRGQGPVAVGGDAEARLVITRRASVLTASRLRR